MLGHTIFDLPFLANSMATLNPPYAVPTGPTVYPYQINGDNLVMWMDAGIIVANDGDPVTTWVNHPSCSAVPSSNISMSQATVAWKPIYRTNGIGGKPSLAFSSSGYGISAIPANTFGGVSSNKPLTLVIILMVTASGANLTFFADDPNGVDYSYTMIPGNDFKCLANSGVNFPDYSSRISSSFVQPVMFTFMHSSSNMFWWENQYQRGLQSIYTGQTPTRFGYPGLGSNTPATGKSTASIAEVMFWSGSSLQQTDITNLFTNYVMKKYPGAGFYQA